MGIKQIYQLAKYYDIGFSRETKGEIEFFSSLFKKYCPFEVKRVMEAACGSGFFLTSFAKAGYQITGYDLSPEMVEYSKEKIREAGCEDKADVVVGDMRTIVFEKPFDSAFNLISSIGYCGTDSEIESHFKNTAKSLRKGALYIVELAFACDDIKNENVPDKTWRVDQPELKIEMTWDPYKYDKEKKIRHIHFRADFNEKGKTWRVEEEHALRLWFYKDFVELAKKGGFKFKEVCNQKFETLPANSHISGERGILYMILQKE